VTPAHSTLPSTPPLPLREESPLGATCKRRKEATGARDEDAVSLELLKGSDIVQYILEEKEAQDELRKKEAKDI